jgi:hypothetical protein
MDVSAYRPIVAGLARGVAAKSECQSYRQTSGDDDSQVAGEHVERGEPFWRICAGRRRKSFEVRAEYS